MADIEKKDIRASANDGGLPGFLLFIAFGTIMLLLLAAACFPEWFGIVIDPEIESGG